MSEGQRGDNLKDWPETFRLDALIRAAFEVAEEDMFHNGEPTGYDPDDRERILSRLENWLKSTIPPDDTVDYLRADVAKERESALIDACMTTIYTYDDNDVPEKIYRAAKLEELK